MAEEQPQNQEIILLSCPQGMVTPENFEVRDCEMPVLGEEQGQTLLQTLYLSVDPYLRYRLATFPVGSVFQSFGVARVISSNGAFEEGDLVTGQLGWKRFQVSSLPQLPFGGLTKIEPTEAVPASAYLGVVGLTGLSAYMPILKIAEPKAGETAFVTGAAGAVGSVVGQILKLRGCRVVGCAGSDEKCAALLELGFDAAFNYKTVDVATALKERCPDGINIYWDNVGGAILDAVLLQMARFGRIVACGAISQYNLPAEERYGLKNASSIIGSSLKMQGFMLPQYAAELAEGRQQLAAWVTEGAITSTETVVEGFENTPSAFQGLFTGANNGKMVVKVADL